MTHYNQRCCASLFLALSMIGSVAAALPENRFSIRSYISCAAALGTISLVGWKAWKAFREGKVLGDRSARRIEPRNITVPQNTQAPQDWQLHEDRELEHDHKKLLDSISSFKEMHKLAVAISPLRIKLSSSYNPSYFRAAISYQVWEIATNQALKIADQSAKNSGKYGVSFSLSAYVEQIHLHLSSEEQVIRILGGKEGFEIRAEKLGCLRSWKSLGFDYSKFREQLKNACDVQVRRKIEEVFDGWQKVIKSDDLKELQQVGKMIKKLLVQDTLEELGFTVSLDLFIRLREEYCLAIDRKTQSLLHQSTNDCRLGKLPLRNCLQGLKNVYDGRLTEEERVIFRREAREALTAIFKERCYKLKKSATSAEELRKIFKTEYDEYTKNEELLSYLSDNGKIYDICRNRYWYEIRYYATNNNEANSSAKSNCLTSILEQYKAKWNEESLYGFHRIVDTRVLCNVLEKLTK